MKIPGQSVFLVLVGAIACWQCDALSQTNSTNSTMVPARSFLDMSGIVTTPARRISPHFTGKKLPLPPEQHSAWSPPDSTLPTNYVSAVIELFDEGMADPRGCDYREIEVGTGSIWSGDGGVVKTHGWVFTDRNAGQFAVCWNGLVYPTVSVGAAADWRADARACISQARRQWRNALPEAYEVSCQTCLPLKGCLLLRLGAPDLAHDLWLARQIANQRELDAMYQQNGMTNATKEPGPELNSADPYLNWASDWAWDLFERAVCAHMRGDDGLALTSAELLSKAQPIIEIEAAKHGFKRQPTYNSPWDGKYQPYLNFLGPLPELLADQRRRAQIHQPAMSAEEITALTNQSARISAWIGALDQVSVRQWGQPGGLGPWESDPIVAGLLKEGTPAIEPLLQCLASDCGNRLTRSVSFGRDFHRDRRLHPVSQPIVDVLVKLMHTSDAAIGINRNAMYYHSISNSVLVAMFRTYWKEYGQLSPPERWFRKLADDHAGEAAWRDALGDIVLEEKVAGNTNKTQLAGEVLRSKNWPSVTALLERRGKTLADSAPAYNPFAIGNATDFLVQSEKWEFSPTLLKIAGQLQEKVMAGYSGTDNVGSADPQNATSIAVLAMLRARHGDTNGLDEYAQWIQGAKPDVLEDSALNALEPFWRFPTYPALQAAAKAMFASTNSQWGTLAWALNARGSLRWQKPIASPALIIPEFRKLVINELTNHAYGGEAINRGGGNLEVKYADGGTVNYGARKDTEGLAVGAQFTFRRCDVIAERLATIPDFPKISLLWPEAKRDQAVNENIKLLTLSGNRLHVRKKPDHWSPAFGQPLVELVN